MEDTATAEPIKKKGESFVPRTTDGFIGRICKIESRRGIIMCLITVVLAIVFIALALTSKIGIMDYSLSIPKRDSEGEKVSTEYSEHYSIDLSIYNFINCAFDGFEIVEYDEDGNEIEKESEFEKKVNKVQAAAQEEFVKWLATHEGTSEVAQRRKWAEICKKHYEEAGVVDVESNLFFYSALRKNPDFGNYMTLMIIATLLFSLAVVIIVGASAICAMIALIKMGQKKQTRIVLRMLMLTFIGSALAVVFQSASAMMAVSPGMLAIAIVSGILWLLLSNAFSFMYGKNSVATIIKYDIMAALMFLSIFLLIAPTFKAVITVGKTSNVYIGDSGIVHVIDCDNRIGKKDLMVSPAISIVVAFGGLFAIAAFFAILQCMVHGQGNSNSKLASARYSTKAPIIATLIALIIIFILKLAIINDLKWDLSLGVCVYLSLAFAVVALILDFVYNPEKKAVAVAPENESSNQ